jgi:hypothetical protein
MNGQDIIWKTVPYHLAPYEQNQMEYSLARSSPEYM